MKKNLLNWGGFFVIFFKILLRQLSFKKQLKFTVITFIFHFSAKIHFIGTKDNFYTLSDFLDYCLWCAIYLKWKGRVHFILAFAFTPRWNSF